MNENACLKQLVDETEATNKNIQESVKKLECLFERSSYRHKSRIHNVIKILKSNIQERKEVIDRIRKLGSISSDFNQIIGILIKLKALDESDDMIYQMFNAYIGEWKN